MKTKIDRNWKFLSGEGSAVYAESNFDDSAWRSLDLPHDWAIEGNFSPEHYIPAVLEERHLEFRADSYLPRGSGWYRKKLEIPEIYPGQRVFWNLKVCSGKALFMLTA